VARHIWRKGVAPHGLQQQQQQQQQQIQLESIGQKRARMAHTDSPLLLNLPPPPILTVTSPPPQAPNTSTMTAAVYQTHLLCNSMATSTRHDRNPRLPHCSCTKHSCLTALPPAPVHARDSHRPTARADDCSTAAIQQHEHHTPPITHHQHQHQYMPNVPNKGTATPKHPAWLLTPSPMFCPQHACPYPFGVPSCLCTMYKFVFFNTPQLTCPTARADDCNTAAIAP
jgi:hypothetical protein